VDSQNVWVIGDENAGYATVLRSTNGGDSWDRLGSAEDFPTGLIDVSAIDADTAWIVGIDGQGHLTTDGGQNWKTMQIITSLYHVNAVCGLDAQNAWAATDQGGVYYTSNGGDDWNDVCPSVEDVPGIKGFELLGITTADSQSVWVTGLEFGYPPEGIIANTINGGTDWAPQTSPVTGVNLSRVSFVGACK